MHGQKNIKKYQNTVSSFMSLTFLVPTDIWQLTVETPDKTHKSLKVKYPLSLSCFTPT